MTTSAVATLVPPLALPARSGDRRLAGASYGTPLPVSALIGPRVCSTVHGVAAVDARGRVADARFRHPRSARRTQARPWRPPAPTRLREGSGGRFDLPTGTVYPALHRLEDAGLIAGVWSTVDGRRRRTYRLTPAGQKRLHADRSNWKEFAAAITALLETRAWPATS